MSSIIIALDTKFVAAEVMTVPDSAAVMYSPPPIFFRGRGGVGEGGGKHYVLQNPYQDDLKIFPPPPPTQTWIDSTGFRETRLTWSLLDRL